MIGLLVFWVIGFVKLSLTHGSLNTITTIAGVGTLSAFGDGGPAKNAGIELPYGMYQDTVGLLYIVDYLDQTVRTVSTSGIISGYAGISGKGDNTGNGGPATSAKFKSPWNVFVNTMGLVYISDSSSCVVRSVSTSGIINLFAGNGGYGDTGDGVSATSAAIEFVNGLWGNSLGVMYVSILTFGTIRAISTDNIITLFAGVSVSESGSLSGNGGYATSAYFNSPEYLFGTSTGVLYISDTGNNEVRSVSTSGIVTNFLGLNSGESASTSTGAATATGLFTPLGIFASFTGEVYVGDSNNYVVRKVTVSSGLVETFAGQVQNQATSVSQGDGGSAVLALFMTPAAVIVDTLADVFISDVSTYQIRRVTPTYAPTVAPAAITSSPSLTPTILPSEAPTIVPSVPTTFKPTMPTVPPSVVPTMIPSIPPSAIPSVTPTVIPTVIPTKTPSVLPTVVPSAVPSVLPTGLPTAAPTLLPTEVPSAMPTVMPTVLPTMLPTVVPTVLPTVVPSVIPTVTPTLVPSLLPTVVPTVKPTVVPSALPSVVPTVMPSLMPTVVPTMMPTCMPTAEPTLTPSVLPSLVPTWNPTGAPSVAPTESPSREPSERPTVSPTLKPSSFPSVFPTIQPTVLPTLNPSTMPSVFPTDLPSALPSNGPTVVPSRLPTRKPSRGGASSFPTVAVTSSPSIAPTTGYVVISFNTSLSLHNVSASVLDGASQTAVVVAVATTLNTSLSSVTVTSQQTVGQEGVRRLNGGTALFQVLVSLNVHASSEDYPDTVNRDGSYLYHKLSNMLIDSVMSRAFSAKLRSKSALLHAGPIMYVGMVNVSVSEYELLAHTFDVSVIDGHESSNLTEGAFAGIVIGILVSVLLLIGCCLLFMNNKCVPEGQVTNFSAGGKASFDAVVVHL